MLFTTLAIAALGFLFMGVVALWSPIRVTSQFGITTLDADGRNEVRGVYGGFGIAVSAALAVTLLIPQWRGAATVAVAVALGGMAFGRIVSAIVDRHIGRFPLFYGTIEGGASLLLLAASLA